MMTALWILGIVGAVAIVGLELVNSVRYED